MSIHDGLNVDLHNIERAEWVRRFGERIKERLNINPCPSLDTIIAAELESWGEDENDWRDTSPETAADENLSEWTDDGC